MFDDDSERECRETRFLALFTAVMLPMFLASLDQTLLATATPHIGRELGSLADTTWLVVAYLVAATVSAPLYGALGDRYSHQRALLASLAVFSVGSLCCAGAGTLDYLILYRVVQGTGAGGLMVLSQALIGQLVVPADRPRYQSYFTLVFTAASIGGPAIGGIVVEHANWRWLFLAQAPLCLFAAWRITKLPPPTAHSGAAAGFDTSGAALFLVAATSGLFWLNVVGRRFALESQESLMMLSCAVLTAVILVRHQRQRARPFMPVDVLRTPGVVMTAASVFCFGGTMFALIFVLPLYLQVAEGASATASGLQLLPLTTGVVIGSLLASRSAGRTGLPMRLPPFGLGLASLSIGTLAVASPGAWVMTLTIGLAGLGLGTVMTSAQMAIQVLGGRSKLGASAAVISLARNTGAAFGTAAFGGLALVMLPTVLASSGVAHPSAVIGEMGDTALGFRITMGALAVFVMLGALAASRAPVIRLRPPA